MIALSALVGAFFLAFRLVRLVSSRTMLEHAAARAARAKAVGFNDFMCEKSARVAMIPVAGRRRRPLEGGLDEISKIPIYLEGSDSARAAAILDYEYWHRMAIDVSTGHGLAPEASAKVTMTTDDFTVSGEAGVESHFPFYMFDGGE